MYMTEYFKNLVSNIMKIRIYVYKIAFYNRIESVNRVYDALKYCEKIIKNIKKLKILKIRELIS